MKHKQNGFTVVEGFIIVVVVALIGFAGWFVWQDNKKDDQSSTAPPDTSQEEQDEDGEPKEKYTIPDGYKLYEDAEIGFKFAYPKNIGQLNIEEVPGNQNIISYRKSSGEDNVFAPYTYSYLIVQVNKKEGSVTNASKYGPMLEYTGGKWIVTAKQGGDLLNGDYSIGSEYKATVARGANDTKVYDFSYEDEGCYRSKWVFESHGGLVQILLPKVCADELGDVPQERLDTYNKEAERVLETITTL